jgi:DNA polymerase-3 subunit alpha
LKEIINKHSGTCPLFFEITTPAHGNFQIKSSSQYFVSVSDVFLSLVQELFGPEAIQINQIELLAMV